jgi:hypothetical protein
VVELRLPILWILGNGGHRLCFSNELVIYSQQFQKLPRCVDFLDILNPYFHHIRQEPHLYNRRGAQRRYVGGKGRHLLPKLRGELC